MKFLAVLLLFYSVVFAEYEPVRGLEAKSTTLKEEGVHEIIIRKQEIIRKGRLLPGFKKPRNYVLFGFSNQITDSVSDSDFGKVKRTGFARPIFDSRFGGEVFFGRIIDSNSHFLLDIGIDYNLIKITNQQNREFQFHSIASMARIFYNVFPEKKLSIYGGGGVGFTLLDLFSYSGYDIKYAPQFGGLLGVSYKIDRSPFELFFGYKILYTPERTFKLTESNIYKTKFFVQNLNLGFTIKF